MVSPARLSPLAIIVGAIAGFLLNLLLTFTHGFVLGLFWWKNTPAHLAEARFAQDSVQCLINLGLILTAAFFGGYTAGWTAPRSAVANAAVVGLVLVIVTLVLYKPMNMHLFPWWFNAADFSLTLPAALAGGHQGRRLRALFVFDD